MVEKVFSTEPLNIENDWDQWDPPPEFAPPPEAGTYRMYLAAVRELDEYETKIGKRLKAVVDFRIVGGEYDTRAVNFQRLNNYAFTRKSDGKTSSQMLDMIKSAGVSAMPRNNAEFADVLNMMKDQGTGLTFGAQLDWEGWCKTCYEASFMKETGAANVKDAKELAKGNYEVFDAAADFATKAKNARGFPQRPDGKRKDSFLCGDCGQEVRARVKVVRFMR
jgi:hypothetical protein